MYFSSGYFWGWSCLYTTLFLLSANTSILPIIQEYEEAATPTKAVRAKCGYFKKTVSEIQNISIGVYGKTNEGQNREHNGV